MAFTPEERARIFKVLGRSPRFEQTDTDLTRELLSVEGNIPVENLIRQDLAAIADIDAKLTDAHDRLRALKVGSISLPGNLEVKTLRSEGRRHIARLAATFGVPVDVDYFGSALPSGNQTSRGYIRGGGSGYGRHG